MNKILACIDFSDVTERILMETGRLANALNAHVLLLHVIPPVTELGMLGPGGVMVQSVDPREQNEKLDSLTKQLSQMGVVSTPKVLNGNIVDSILLEAQTQLPERIILGSHGHGRLYKLLVGSVAEAVLRRSKIPVLVVPSLV